ncbi:MAG: hypothetical protein ACT4PX_00415 [Actinomycetota bacterium]
MAARVLAVLAAVAMVAGAVAVRDRLDDRAERRTTTLRLVCASELAPVCEALEAEPDRDVVTTVEPAAVTAERLTGLAAGAALDLDGWLVPGPWPQMVADARRRAGQEAPLGAGPVLARSPVVLAVWKDRAAVLAPRCQNGGPGWKCLGEVAGQPWEPIGGRPDWGPVKPGLPLPSGAVGLAVRGAATAAWFGRVDLSSADLDDGGYRDWLSRLERSQPSSPVSPLEAMLLKGPAAFDAVGTVEAEAGPLLARSARPDKPDLLYPSPVATADVVLGASPTSAGRLLAGLVSGPVGREALAAAGWRVPGVAAARGVPATPPLPAGDGLPPRGFLAALRVVVAEVRR